MDARAVRSRQSRKVLWGMNSLILIYVALALLCLRQGGSSRPWSRVDFFSGSYLLLSTVLALEQNLFSHRLSRSPEVMHEFFGATFDSFMMKMAAVLGLGELVVFADYARWRLPSWLEVNWLQTLGLFIYVMTLGWLTWVDIYLMRNFADNLATKTLMTTGPYSYIRHPRYAGLIGTRLAFSLMFASVLAWCFALAWVVVVKRRIGLEELHLRQSFGTDYEAYAQCTARLLPGIF